MIILLDKQLSRNPSVSYQKSEIVAPETQELVQDMWAAMLDAGGIGLSAPQVGVNRRLIIIGTFDFKETMFNPVVMKRSGKLTMTEGCLSFPGTIKEVTRSSEITIKYLDRTGKPRYLEASGLIARVILHEIEHLDGKNFLDHE